MSLTCQSYSLNFPRIPRIYTFLSEANWNFMLQGAKNRIISYLLPRSLRPANRFFLLRVGLHIDVFIPGSVQVLVWYHNVLYFYQHNNNSKEREEKNVVFFFVFFSII